MIKFMILFRQPEDVDEFENVYQDFLALVERMPHILRRQVVHVTGSPQGAPEHYRILELYFESHEIGYEALLTPSGQEAGNELARLPKDSYQLLLCDVYEEAGGSTPRAIDDKAAVTKTKSTSAGDAADEEPAWADSDTVVPSSAE